MMKRSHKIIFFLIALLAFGTFAFGILQLVGAHHAEPVAGSPTSNSITNR
jgi:hypothetical protein